jgi:hypothetical protein
MAQPPEVKGRLSRAVAQLNTLLGAGGAASGRGALIQVWMPSQLNDGSTVLSAQVRAPHNPALRRRMLRA